MKLVVENEDAGKRLDVYLTERTAVSRAFIAKLCEQEKVTVNAETAKVKHKLKGGDTVTVDYDFDQAQAIPEIDLPILYEDDDCIVINKPAGVLTHSKGAFNPEATVATFIAPKLINMDGERGGIVHRLDRATSGVIICAKTPQALTHLQKQFSERNTKKTYHAVIEQTLEPKKAIIDIPIGRNPRDPKTFYTTAHGKSAQTQYEVIQEGPLYSLVELQPKTGRTHQLRVHLKHLKHPIVGDEFYGGKPADRLYLHATSLEITLPSSKREVFSVPLPEEFSDKIHES